MTWLLCCYALLAGIVVLFCVLAHWACETIGYDADCAGVEFLYLDRFSPSLFRSFAGVVGTFRSDADKVAVRIVLLCDSLRSWVTYLVLTPFCLLASVCVVDIS